MAKWEAGEGPGFYEALGVSSAKDAVEVATAKLSKGLFPGAFCRIFPDLAGDPDYCLVMHSDGVGTKVAAHYLMNLLGLDPNAWKKPAQDGLVMNLDDMGCVGALGPFYVSSSTGRNACINPANPGVKVISDQAIADLVDGAQEFCDFLTSLGFPCVLTGGETADVGNLVRTSVVDYTVVCRMRRDQVIDPLKRIELGNVIIGFSSTGQAAWEKEPNSGLGSNGLTAAQHGLLDFRYRGYTETYAPEIPKELIYRGKHKLDDPLPGDDFFTIGSALISPTRTYLPLIKLILSRFGRNIHALIHCTGGGQTKIKKFGRPGLIYNKHSPFPIPPIFRAIQASSGMSWQEMYQTFNMGHRLEAVVPHDQALIDDLIAMSRRCGIEAKEVGNIQAGDASSRSVMIQSEYGTFLY